MGKPDDAAEAQRLADDQREAHLRADLSNLPAGTMFGQQTAFVLRRLDLARDERDALCRKLDAAMTVVEAARVHIKRLKPVYLDHLGLSSTSTQIADTLTALEAAD